MAVLGESDWQLEKTLAECMRHMLDNEIATDVCFEVGPQDGTTVNIRAHKYMLISRSPVFQVMFSGGMKECQSGPEAMVRVEDIDPAVFRQLLIYIYYEGKSINMVIAASLMYAAKKYMLPKLVRECGKCLSQGLNLHNVIHVREHSLLFDDTELKSECLQLIGHNAKAVLTGIEITSASPRTMETILQVNNIHSREIVIYETCIAWAKHHFQHKGSTENPTDQQIREILGDLLYKIRFPTMEVTEFAEISEGKNVLTEGEKTSIYYFLATKKKCSQLMFSTERRHSEEMWVDRTVTCSTGGWRSSTKGDALDFTTDRDILLTGVGLYTGFNGKGYAVDVEVKQSTTSLFKKRVTVPYTGDSKPFKIPLDEAIFITAGDIYSVKALPHDVIGYFGRPCKAICTKENVTFTFKTSADSERTTETLGQIPRLYFYCSEESA